MKRIASMTAAALLLSSAASLAGQAKPVAQKPAAAAPSAQPAAGITPPADYLIGAGDVLIVTFWMEPDMTDANAVVRPDGMITLPLLNDVTAAGLKPEELRDRLAELSKKTLLEDPRVTVGVRAINSRKVFVVGSVQKPGPYDLLAPLDVMSLLSIAGGLREFTDGKKIRILRDEGGKQTSLLFNYREVEEGKNLRQNIQLKPGDRVIVPE
jgi:polysaccharide export outer membrane protein